MENPEPPPVVEAKLSSWRQLLEKTKAARFDPVLNRMPSEAVEPEPPAGKPPLRNGPESAVEHRTLGSTEFLQRFHTTKATAVRIHVT